MINISKKGGKHKIRKREPDLFEAYEKEMKALYPEFEEKPVKKVKVKKSKGIHKVQNEEEVLPFFLSPEDMPEDESQEDWLERQRKGYEEQAEDFKKMAETGKKFALGSYHTFEKAKRSAKRLGRGLSGFYRQMRMKLGMKVPTIPPVQVFIEPTEEGDYVVYGQVTKKEVPVMRPTQPIKVYEEKPLKEEEYLKYEELM